MAFFRYGFLVLAAVFLLFAKKSEGNMTAVLSEATEAEKFLASNRFQIAQDAVIMAGTDIESLVTKKIMNEIRNNASQCQADGVPTLALNAVLKGLLTTVRLVSTIGQNANKAIDIAMTLKADPLAATDAIKKGFKADETIIFVAGVPVHDGQGSALAISGGAAQQGLKKSVVAVQKAGQSALEALEVAGEIATLGIKAGGITLNESFKAAREAVATGELVVFSYISEASQYAFDGLRNAASKAPNQGYLTSGIIDSLKTNVSTENIAALDAISRLNNGLKSVLSISTKKPAIDAALIMNQGLISTILVTADAISVAKNALEKAGKLANLDTEAAVIAVRKGIKAAQDELLNGSAGGYLGLGAAGQIAGIAATEGLIPAVLEIEYGRVAAYEDLKLAERTACAALWAKGLAAAQGIYAAIQMCEAAGSALYTQFADGGEIGFDVLRSI